MTLCAAALVAALLTGCSGGDSALYRWKASTAEKDAAVFAAQLASGERTNEAAVMYTEKGEETIHINSFPAQAEELSVDLACRSTCPVTEPPGLSSPWASVPPSCWAAAPAQFPGPCGCLWHKKPIKNVA